MRRCSLRCRSSSDNESIRSITDGCDRCDGARDSGCNGCIDGGVGGLGGARKVVCGGCWDSGVDGHDGGSGVDDRDGGWDSVQGVCDSNGDGKCDGARVVSVALVVVRSSAGCGGSTALAGSTSADWQSRLAITNRD